MTSTFSIKTWRKLGEEERLISLKTHLKGFLEANPHNCYDTHNKKTLLCDCIKQLHDEVVFNAIITFLNPFFLKFKAEQENIIKDIIHTGLLLRTTARSKVKNFAITFDLGKKNVFFCKNTLQMVLNFRQKEWTKLSKLAKQGLKGEEQEETTLKRKRDLNEVNVAIISFLDRLAKEEGEFHATRFVRDKASLHIRDGDTEILELPSYFTKRQLYSRFCYERGWNPQTSARGTHGPLKDYPKRQHDSLLWPEGTEAMSIPSWSAFLRV